MKIKDNVVFSYNELARAYVFDFDKMQKKKVGKVTSRMFPILINKNQFQGVGYAVLDRVGFLESEAIEEWYTVRGALGEWLANLYLKNMIKKYKGVDITTKLFKPSDFPYYDMFYKSNEKFGGVVDIGISEPLEYRGCVEVKSKNIKDYDHEKKSIKYENEEEILQGKMLAVLSKVDTLYMAWVFFTNEQEDKIKKATELIVKNNKLNAFDVEKLVAHLGLSIDNVVVSVKKYDVNREEILNQMETAHRNLHRIISLGSIDIAHFTPTERLALDDELRKRSGKVYDPDDDLPY